MRNKLDAIKRFFRPQGAGLHRRQAQQPQSTGKPRGALALLLTAAFLCLFSGCQSKDPAEENPTVDAYLVGEETAPAIPAKEGVEIRMTDPTTYAYMGLEDAGAAVKEYVDFMTAEENGFSIVGKNYGAITETPDYTQKKGSVNLAKATTKEEGKLLVLQLDWSPGICTVVVSIQNAPGDSANSDPHGLTHMDATELIQKLHPSVLQLSGDSMNAYHIYIRNGLVVVKDRPCIWVEIYTSQTKAGTNAYVGTYYLSRDGKQLYALDRSNNSIQELKIS